jgi:hydroxymethylpyrimidine pyrophosphatase-like HAD family hydrolase
MSRSAMAPEHQEIFEKLCKERDVIVVTGGSMDSILEQITPRFEGMYYKLPESGNRAVGKDGTFYWNDLLTEEQIAEITRCIEALKKHFGIRVKDENDLVEYRGAQVGYSVLGYHEDVDKKYAFDPGDVKRQAALRALPEAVGKVNAVGITVVPGGTTTFNFIPTGKDKGHNITRFLAKMNWEKKDCVYIGDALFPGGNDETVIGVIDTHAVKDPDETFSYIKEVLKTPT